MRTVLTRKEDVQRRWFHIDAAGCVLGKLAVKAANILTGKEKPTYTPGVDTGDFVLVTNARAVHVTGRKEEGKKYWWHSEHVGSGVHEPLASLRGRSPETIIRQAVRRMLPKNNLGRQQVRRLKVYAGADHLHAAQQPQTITVPNKGNRAPRGKKVS